MKVAVFGAAGWTGRAVLANLAGRHEIRAIDRGPAAWQEWEDIDGPWDGEEVVHSDIVDFDAVHEALEGMDAVIHLTAFFPRGDHEADDAEKTFLINVKGLWNVLESSHRHGIGRIVHMGSCQTVHPNGVFFSSEVRRPDASLYAVSKRLQEEMCRQMHDGRGMRIVVFRPNYIIDGRLGLGRFREKFAPGSKRASGGCVCRHDLAEACRLAIEAEHLEFEILHTVGTTRLDHVCNAARTRQVLGLEYASDLEAYE